MIKASSLIVVGSLCCGLSSAWAAAIRDEPLLPASGDTAGERLNASPRHGEWVDIEEGRGNQGGWNDSVRAWVSYPERATTAPVVIVIHEIFGLTDWIRSVADQLAAAGFIAIAPDLLTGVGPAGETPEDPQEAIKLVRGLRIEDVTRRLTAVARYGKALPASNGRFGSVGFCWGGGTSFAYAGHEMELGAAVVYYGTTPKEEILARIRTPVVGFYGGDDARVNATIPLAESEMSGPEQSFTKNVYDGAGHGFLRQQSGREGANLEAAKAAWPSTVEFLKEHLETD